MSELADPSEEADENPTALFKRLQRSHLVGQPLLPFIFCNTDFESCILHDGGTGGGSRGEKKSKYQSTLWEASPSIPAPLSIFSRKSLHTLQRLIVKRWAPQAKSGSDLLEECLANRRFLSTGFVQFDNLLEGGLLTGEITEIFGASAVGKTQMCLNAAAAVVVASRLLQGDTSGVERPKEVSGPSVLYLDTKGEFDVRRLRNIIRWKLKKARHWEDVDDLDRSTNQCLSRVWHRLLPEIQELVDGLAETRLCVASSTLRGTSGASVQLSAEEADFYSNLRLVVIDCITAPFAAFTGVFPNETTFHVQTIVTELRRISADFHVAVLVTNNLRYGLEVPRGCLGELWSTVPHLSLYMHAPETPPSSLLHAAIAIRRKVRCTDCKDATIDDTNKPSDCCVIDFTEGWEEATC